MYRLLETVTMKLQTTTAKEMILHEARQRKHRTPKKEQQLDWSRLCKHNSGGQMTGKY